MVPPPSRSPRPCAAALALASAVALWASHAGAEPRPKRCDELLDHPDVVAWSARVAEAPGPVYDLTPDGWLGETAGAELGRRFDDTGFHLRIVALEVPHRAPLVEVTCALGRRLKLSNEDVMVVVSRVGLHAYAPSMGYHRLRRMARRRNAAVKASPARAASAFARDVLEAARAKRRERDLLGALGVVCLLTGILVLVWMALRRTGSGAAGAV